MQILLHPTYFPSIPSFAAMVRHEVLWEVHDNFQKQTYRNRCYICNDQGRHMLNIPIRHVGGEQGRQKYREVVVDNSYPWQRQHWRTLQTAYRTSPFFEFYENDMAPLFHRTHHYLLDFNLKTIEILCDCIGISMPSEKTTSYRKVLEGNSTETKVRDFRFLVNAKREPEFEQRTYVQVFGDRHGFVKNTSVLDLLFNEGPNALVYLQQQSLEIKDA